jgi:heme O synthase-like polyprenyltransferase
VYTAVLIGVSLMLYPTGAVGMLYLVAAVVLGLGLFAAAWRLRSEPEAAMRFFGWSNGYLATLFLAMLVDAVI